MSRFYKLEDRNRQRFLKVPKDLILNDYYRDNLSSTSKLVYGLLLDRMELSRKNEWVNDDNEIYLLYTKQDLAEDLSVSERTVYNSFNELEDLGLIKQERQGLNKPNKIFIAKTNADAKESSQPDMKRPSGQDVNDMQSSETDVSDTNYKTYTLPSSDDSEAVAIYLELFERYTNVEHQGVKASIYNEVRGKMGESYGSYGEKFYREKLIEYFEGFDYESEGLPKLPHLNEVWDRYFL